MLLIPNVTPRLPPSPYMGRDRVFLHNTPLIPSSSLQVKRLTQMCYGWNIVGYMLTVTQLNNQCETNLTASLPFQTHLGSNHNYYPEPVSSLVVVVLWAQEAHKGKWGCEICPTLVVLVGESQHITPIIPSIAPQG
jgi:hypothetical protein